MKLEKSARAWLRNLRFLMGSCCLPLFVRPWSTSETKCPRCIAVTPDGLVLGVLDQMHYNRPQAKDDTMTKEVKKNRPIEESATTLPQKVTGGWL
jgi:hypothetical protein